jgi:excisionase family DNA binding protein
MTRWLTVEQSAERAGVSVPTIRRAISEKNGAPLRSYKLQPGGRLIRVREADLDAWITSHAENEAA